MFQIRLLVLFEMLKSKTNVIQIGESFDIASIRLQDSKIHDYIYSQSQELTLNL